MFLGLCHYANGNYEEAVKAGRRSLSERPAYTANLRILAAALAASDRPAEAVEVGKRLLALEPTFTVSDYERTRMPFRDGAIRSSYRDHLRKAGLPM
jgi:adenylate cyclase